MRVGGGMALLLAAALGIVRAASGQVSVYADLSASKLTSPSSTSVLFGPTVGVSAVFAEPGRFHLAGDLRASFVGGGQRLDGIGIGPKVSVTVKRFARYEPYAELLVGFARYNDGPGSPFKTSTDGELQVNAGVDRAVRGNFDWRVFEFGYAQYYGLGGVFNPKTFSTGVVYHVGGRK